MHFLNEIMIALAIVGYTTGRSINSESQRNLDSENELIGTASSISHDEETKSELFISIDKLRRILKHQNSYGAPQHSRAPMKEFLRLRRSYTPYTSENRRQWQQIGSKGWRSHSNPDQFVSVNGLDSSAIDSNSQYKILKQFEKENTTTNDASLVAPSTSEKNMNTEGIDDDEVIPEGARTYDDSDRPIWNIRAYRPNNAKPSRFSRASEQNSATVTAPPSSLKVDKMSENMVYITENFLERNEIPSFPFFMPDSPKPSLCTWAILSCCAATTEDINQSCFKRLGCDEQFWSYELCRPDYIEIAMKVAEGFYTTISN